MSVYLINNMRIHDRTLYERYAAGMLPAFLAMGGEVVAVADAPKPLEGDWPYDRTVLLRFPSLDAARAWWESPEYQAIAPLRHQSARSNVVVLDAFRKP